MALSDLPEGPFDGILVGAGHNSLVAAAYLAKAGQKVLVLDGSDHVGGGVTTHEVTLPGFRHNLHAYFVRWTPDYRIWKDLQLDSTGLESIYPEVQNALPFADGADALVTYRDMEPSLEAIGRLSPADAAAYAKLYVEFSELITRIEAPLRFAAPIPPDELAELLEASGLGRRYLDLAARSALELILEWFESEPLRALIAFNVSIRGYLPVFDMPGTGSIAPLAMHNSHDGRIIKGGSGMAAEALAQIVTSNGGSVVTGARVASIDVADGRARGVTLEDGRTIGAGRFVVSGVPAPMTLLDLVGRSHLDAGLVAALEQYPWLEEALFGVHLALEDRPRFTAESSNPDVPRALNLAIGYESSGHLIAHMEAMRQGGNVDRGPFHGSIPTLHDPTQAPAGRHTAFAWHFTQSGSVDRSPAWTPTEVQEREDAVVAEWEHYAPGTGKATLTTFSHSPADTQALIPSMLFGDRHHGSYRPANWGTNRPHPSLADYRTPIDSLYLCASTQHPGGSFTGIPGYNAAGAIAVDLGIDPWWQPIDIRVALRSLT